MIVNYEDTAIFDVDNTLVKWIEPGMIDEPGVLKLNFYGMTKYVKEIKVHTEFLKSLKARGYFIRVHTGNGATWGDTVVKALGLEEYVDSVETKPSKVIDDKPPDDWIHTIYLGDT